MRRPSEQDRECTEFVTARRAGLVRVATLLVSGDPAKAEDVVQTVYPSGRRTVVVQVPASTGRADDQIVAFARGITVNGS